MREHGSKKDAGPELHVHGREEKASFQVIVLGSTGGPREDNVTGLLVRAPQSKWRKGSVIAVDAGVHLGSIVRILEQNMPRSSDKIRPAGETTVLKNNPFAGIKFPYISAKANALYIFRELLHSVLITHPHLDHVSGIAINTPALEYGREAKAIVALPSTIDAIKHHIFNDFIWPNLSDEGHGVGFVTYRRLIEGGNPRLGAGEARGYVNVCDGLATKCWSVSHGKCHRRVCTPSHQRGESFGWGHNDYSFPSRRMSRMSDHDHGYFAAVSQQQHAHNAGAFTPAVGGSQGAPPTPIMHPSQPGSAIDGNHMFEPVSSSAFFIRNDVTGDELLIFGDIEPDTVSLVPRNHIVWEDAAAKFVAGHLKAIFIECSYDDSVRDADLYGHLCPRHLIAELRWLAGAVVSTRKVVGHNLSDEVETRIMAPTSEMHLPPPADAKRKRKRGINGDLATTPEMAPTEFATPPSPRPLQSGYVGSRAGSNSRRKTSHASNPETNKEGDMGEPRQRGRSVQFSGSGPSSNLPAGAATAGHHPNLTAGTILPKKLDEPLKGLAVHIIHVKDTMMDGPAPGDIILEELKMQSADAGLGVVFHVASFGETVWV